MVGCGHSLEWRGGGGFRIVDNAPGAESSKHDGTICVPSGGTAVPQGGTTVPPLYPQEVRRYHPCTFRTYDSTTLVPGGGTLVKFLSFFKLKSHLGG